MREGGRTVWNTLKEVRTEKKGGEAKNLKIKVQAGSRDECLKKVVDGEGWGEGGGGCLEPPYKTMMFTSRL